MAEGGARLEVARNVLALEAMLLDEREWERWLALYLPDCEYWVPTWRDEETLTSNPQAELSHIFYANRTGLEDRVARINSGKSPASSPLRRTTHMIANIVLVGSGSEQELDVRSSWTCHVYDPHRTTTYILFGHSLHRLNRRDDRWLIAKRKTIVQNDTLPAMVDFYCI